MIIQLWGGQRDGETYSFDDDEEPPTELNVSPMRSAYDGSPEGPVAGNVIALVYSMTEEFMSDGSRKFKYSRDIHRETIHDPLLDSVDDDDFDDEI